MKAYDLIRPYIRENRLLILCGLLSLLTVDILQLFIPRIIKHAIDALTYSTADAALLLRYSLYIVGIAFIICIFRYLWRRCLIGTSRRVEEGLRNTLFKHLLKLSASYFTSIKTGDLMAHATNDIMHIRMATGMGMVALTDAVFLGSAAIGFMLYINVHLTLLALIPMPFIALSAKFFSKRMHRLYRKVQGSYADLTENVRERYAGIRIVKAFNRETLELETITRQSRDYYRQNIALARITGSFFPLMIFFTNLSLVIVIGLGGRQTIAGTITTGDFVAFISYLGLMTWPMMALGWVTNLIQRGRASLERIALILEVKPEIDDLPGKSEQPSLQHQITVEEVSFQYQNTAGNILRQINLEIPSGGAIGFIGPPGSGKSTLLSLIPRFYDVTSGRIAFDGIDIRNLRLADLRSQIAYVPQEPFLFDGTILYNLTFGNPRFAADSSNPALNRALRRAFLEETIDNLPDGLETVVGEKGVILSGGQKQRIALARALLSDAALIVLDDPISQVDAHTGAGIVENLKRLKGQKTILITSHRLAAVCWTDRIFVLREGSIIQSGPHESLMETDNYYSKMFHLQSVGTN